MGRLDPPDFSCSPGFFGILPLYRVAGIGFVLEFVLRFSEAFALLFAFTSPLDFRKRCCARSALADDSPYSLTLSTFLEVVVPEFYIDMSSRA